MRRFLMRPARVAMATVLLAAMCTLFAEVGPSGLASAQTVDAVLVTVRIGNDGGFDRVVFEFRGDVAVQATLGGPSTNPGTIGFDPSDEPVAIAGAQLVTVRMTPATATGVVPPDPAYAGPTSFSPTDTANVVQVVETGDFEAVLNWAIGLRTAATPTLHLLTDPVRVVVDIPHAAAAAAPVTQPATFTG